MHAIMFVVLAGCYFSTAFYPDAERVIWMRSGNSELAYSSMSPIGTALTSITHPVTVDKLQFYYSFRIVHPPADISYWFV